MRDPIKVELEVATEVWEARDLQLPKLGLWAPQGSFLGAGSADPDLVASDFAGLYHSGPSVVPYPSVYQLGPSASRPSPSWVPSFVTEAPSPLENSPWYGVIWGLGGSIWVGPTTTTFKPFPSSDPVLGWPVGSTYWPDSTQAVPGAWCLAHVGHTPILIQDSGASQLVVGHKPDFSSGLNYKARGSCVVKVRGEQQYAVLLAGFELVNQPPGETVVIPSGPQVLSCAILRESGGTALRQAVLLADKPSSSAWRARYVELGPTGLVPYALYPVQEGALCVSATGIFEVWVEREGPRYVLRARKVSDQGPDWPYTLAETRAGYVYVRDGVPWILSGTTARRVVDQYRSMAGRITDLRYARAYWDDATDEYVVFSSLDRVAFAYSLSDRVVLTDLRDLVSGPHALGTCQTDSVTVRPARAYLDTSAGTVRLESFARPGIATPPASPGTWRTPWVELVPGRYARVARISLYGVGRDQSVSLTLETSLDMQSVKQAQSWASLPWSTELSVDPSLDEARWHRLTVTLHGPSELQGVRLFYVKRGVAA